MSNSDKDRNKVQPKITPPKDDFYMGMALMTASVCSDPFGQQAAVIVDNRDRYLVFGVNVLASTEYNGKKFGWDVEGRDAAMVCAVMAAIDRALKLYVPGSTACEPFLQHKIFITGPILTKESLKRCAVLGLKDVVYGPVVPQYFDDQGWERVLVNAKEFGIRVKEFDGNLNWMRDRLAALSKLF